MFALRFTVGCAAAIAVGASCTSSPAPPLPIVEMSAPELWFAAQDGGGRAFLATAAPPSATA